MVKKSKFTTVACQMGHSEMMGSLVADVLFGHFGESSVSVLYGTRVHTLVQLCASLGTFPSGSKLPCVHSLEGVLNVFE